MNTTIRAWPFSVSDKDRIFDTHSNLSTLSRGFEAQINPRNMAFGTAIVNEVANASPREETLVILSPNLMVDQLN